MQVTVYLADIRELRGREGELFDRLTPMRRDKALKYKLSDDRLLSAAAGLILHEKVGLCDSDISFTERGKPVSDNVFFSISHSGSFAVVAVSDAPVGVDIEKIREFKKSLILRVFTKSEIAAGDGAEYYTTLWTKNESSAKLTGNGISVRKTNNESDTVFHSARLEDCVLTVAAEDEFTLEIEYASF